MIFEITYLGDLLATCAINNLSIKFLESLFYQYDEEYGLSESYDEVGEFVTDLVLGPVYD